MNPSTGPAREAANTPRRMDARRNHQRVVAAAVEVFREYGAQASVPQIAARAQEKLRGLARTEELVLWSA